jgi:hypothetical protein
MTRHLLAAAFLFLCVPAFADECKPTQAVLDHLRSEGFKVYELPDQWKRNVLLFEKQHQGPQITDFLTSVTANPWYGIYQDGAMLGDGPGRRGAFMVSDKDKQCLIFNQELSGDLVYHVLKGDW